MSKLEYDSKKFTMNGHPITKDDLWWLICKYEARHPKDKHWTYTVNKIQKLLEGQVKDNSRDLNENTKEKEGIT